MESKSDVCKVPTTNTNKSNRIPRPPNAFMLYANNNRKKLAVQYPHDSNKDISCRLGQQWKILEPPMKEHYFEMAKSIDLEHKRKYPDYVYNPKEARLRKAMRENTNARKSANGTQKQGSKKSETPNLSETQTLNKPYQFIQSANSYVQIVPANSWMQMNNMGQQPHIWIQYHPANVTVPKSLVLVPPRVVNFSNQASSTFLKPQFCEPQVSNQILKEASQNSAATPSEMLVDDKANVCKMPQFPCALLNANDLGDKSSIKCQNLQPEKMPPLSKGNRFIKPNPVLYSNPINFDCSGFHYQGQGNFSNNCNFNEDFDMYSLMSADPCSKYVCINGQYMQANVNLTTAGNFDSQILNPSPENMVTESVQALDLSKVASDSEELKCENEEQKMLLEDHVNDKNATV